MKTTRLSRRLTLTSFALLGSVVAAGFFAVVPTAADAQSAQAAGTPDVIATTPLEEILVTAQRRSEKMVDVPISITALAPPVGATSQLSRVYMAPGAIIDV